MKAEIESKTQEKLVSDKSESMVLPVPKEKPVSTKSIDDAKILE